MSSEGRVFPILDRRAPVLERVRNGRKGPIGSQIASKLGDFIDEEDRELRLDEMERIRNDFRRTLSDILNIDEEQVSDTAVERVAEVFSMGRTDVISMENIQEDEQPKEKESEDGDSSDDEEELFK